MGEGTFECSMKNSERQQLAQTQTTQIAQIMLQLKFEQASYGYLELKLLIMLYM